MNLKERMAVVAMGVDFVLMALPPIRVIEDYDV